MIHVVDVMNKKAKELHSIKYGGFTKTPERDVHVDALIQDIQALARKIANDTGHYQKN